jgi:hypothetical protein
MLSMDSVEEDLAICTLPQCGPRKVSLNALGLCSRTADLQREGVSLLRAVGVFDGYESEPARTGLGTGDADQLLDAKAPGRAGLAAKPARIQYKVRQDLLFEKAETRTAENLGAGKRK